jgi:hypothetical protein
VPRRLAAGAALGILLLLPAASRAAVVVTLPKAGEYVAWVNTRGDEGAVAGPVRAEGSKIVLDTGTAKNPGDWSLLVEDPDGNAAVQPVPKGDSPRVTLKPEMFDRIAAVAVTVTDKDGAAPDYATVTLTDGKGKSQTARLSPDDAGHAVFHNAAAGDGKVTVRQGDIGNKQTVTVRLPAQRDTPVLTLTNDFQLPDGMKTTTAKAAAPGAAPSQPKVVDTSRSLWGFLIALVILGVIGWIFYGVLRNKGVTAKSALARAGIQLPDDETIPDEAVLATAPAAVDPNVCPFCGGAKDANGVCANCAIGATPAQPAPSGGGSGRRLVAVSGPLAGRIFPLTAPVTIGRDPGRDIAVPDDAALSRSHATVKPNALGTEIIDQNSSNGTWVNGRRVEDRGSLQPGDEITVGGSRFRYEA